MGEKPLGKYCMYFAHHNGKHIRLAYANIIHGPWKIHEKGTLQLEQAKSFRRHVASPDVHIDEKSKKILCTFMDRSLRDTVRKQGLPFLRMELNYNIVRNITVFSDTGKS